MSTLVAYDYGGAVHNHPPLQYNRDYGSVNPGKVRRSWGDILKLGNKGKKESPPASVISNGSHYYAPSVMAAQHQQGYSRECYHKYGPSGLYSQPVYMTPSVQMNGIGYTGAVNQNDHWQNGGNGNCPSKGNTIKYTEWFGSVATRRPNIRPEIPSFVQPQIALQAYSQPAHDAGSGMPWTAEQQQYVAIAMPPGVCICPTANAGTTRAKRKRKCKMCGQKTINIRHTLTAHTTYRPALAASVYATPVQTQQSGITAMAPVRFRPDSWGGWNAAPQYAVPLVLPPPVPPMLSVSDDDSSPPTPETVRSVKSSDSTVTLTREISEMIPRDTRRCLNPHVPRGLQENKKAVVINNKTALSAYTLIKPDAVDALSSDTDDLSDNAVHDPLSDSLSSSSERSTRDSESFKRFQASRSRGRRVSIVSIGEDSTKDNSNVIKITTSSPKAHVSNGDVKCCEEGASDSQCATIIVNGNDAPKDVKPITNFSKEITNNLSPKQFELRNSNSRMNLSQKDVSISMHNEKNRRKKLLTKTVPNQKNKCEFTLPYNNVQTENKPNGKELKQLNLPRNRSVTSSESSDQKQLCMDDFNHDSDSNYDSSDTLHSLTNSTSLEALINVKQKQSIYNDILHDNSNKIWDQDEEEGPEDVVPPNEGHSLYSVNPQPIYLTTGRMNRSVSSAGDIIYEENEDLDSTIDGESTDSNDRTLEGSETLDNFGVGANNGAVKLITVTQPEDANDLTEDPAADNLVLTPHNTEGFLPSLSELLHVKSILKRPNSLDTSSENDSDFYAPESKSTSSNNRKKSVQFSAAAKIKVTADLPERPTRSLASPEAPRRDKSLNLEETSDSFDLFGELSDVYSRATVPVTTSDVSKSNAESSSDVALSSDYGVPKNRDSSRSLTNGYNDIHNKTDNEIPVKRRTKRNVKENKMRHSTSSIPVVDLSVKSGYTSGSTAGQNSGSKLSKPRSEENLKSQEIYSKTYHSVPTPDVFPTGVSSRYDSNWEAIRTNNNLVRYSQLAQGKEKSKTAGLRLSKLPSPVKPDSKSSSVFHFSSSRAHHSSTPSIKSSFYRGLNDQTAGSSEELSQNKSHFYRSASEDAFSVEGEVGQTSRRNREKIADNEGCELASRTKQHSNNNTSFNSNKDEQSAINLSILARQNNTKADPSRKPYDVRKNNVINKRYLCNSSTNETNKQTNTNVVKKQQISNRKLTNGNLTTRKTNGSGILPLRPTRIAPAVPPGKKLSQATARPTVPPPPPPPAAPPPPAPTSHSPPPPPSDPPPPIPSHASHLHFHSRVNSVVDFEDSYRKQVEAYPDYSSSPPSYSPPSSPPPPLPKSSPPLLETHNQTPFSDGSYGNKENNSSPRSSSGSSTNYPLTTFRGVMIAIPTVSNTSSNNSPKDSTYNSNDSSPRYEMHYCDSKSIFPQAMPIFSAIDEETKTATIRGRVKPSGPSLTLNLGSQKTTNAKSNTLTSRPVNRQPNPSLTSFDPLRRPRSMSPDDPYEHIYEELSSIPSSPTQANQLHPKLQRLCRTSHYASQPSLLSYSSTATHVSTLTNSQSVLPSSGCSYSKQEKLRHAQTLPPGLGKSLFDGASKLEILEILKNAKGRLSNAADEDEDISPLALDFSGSSADVVGVVPEIAGGDDAEEGGSEDPFDAVRLHSTRVSNISSNSDSSESSGLIRTDKERLACADIERTDSGVGSETSKATTAPPHRPLTRVTTLSSATSTLHGGVGEAAGGTMGGRDPEMPLCEDCDAPVDTRVTSSGVVYAPLVCRRCSRRRQERREILLEIIETEFKYGKDLRIIVEQFYRPIQIAGLLSNSQLDGIFLNVPQLLAESVQFSDQLQDAYDIAVESGDEDLLTVNIAKFFLQANTMMDAFEYYCVRQGESSMLLQTLEKEKELLRIFLRVSQMENTLLRRMNLHSFLMVPVQRVTKYPLLLSRLLRATPPSQTSRRDCRLAKEELERRLHRMNNETKEAPSSKIWRRISMSVGSSTPSRAARVPAPLPTSDDAAKLHKLVVDSLQWGAGAVVREGRLLLLPPDTNTWTLRGRPNKMTPVHVLLVTHGRPVKRIEDSVCENGLLTPRDLSITEAALVAFKYPARPTKQALYKEPWVLSRCVVSWEAEGDAECFEVSDLITKDTYYFKDRDMAGTEDWFRLIQFHAVSVGAWKRRRSAFHNIMISGMSSTR